MFNAFNAVCLMCIQRSCRCVIWMRTTNADSSLWRRRRSEFREFQDRHSDHCGDADERMSGNYGQTAILSGGGVHVLLYLYTAYAYWTVITSRVTVARSGVGYATPRPEGSRLGASQDREIGKMCKRVCVRERCRRDERGDSMEQTRETVKGGSRPREREKPPENYKLYVVPNRPSKIIPAHPAAIMNM